MTEIAKCLADGMSAVEIGEAIHVARMNGESMIGYHLRMGEIAAILFATPEPKPNTARVRIGYWSSRFGDGPYASLLADCDDPNPDCIITADIPIPQPVEVVGTTAEN